MPQETEEFSFFRHNANLGFYITGQQLWPGTNLIRCTHPPTPDIEDEAQGFTVTSSAPLHGSCLVSLGSIN